MACVTCCPLEQTMHFLFTRAVTMIWYIYNWYNNAHNKLQNVSAKHFLKHPCLTLRSQKKHLHHLILWTFKRFSKTVMKQLNIWIFVDDKGALFCVESESGSERKWSILANSPFFENILRSRLGWVLPVCMCLCDSHLFWSGNTAR